MLEDKKTELKPKTDRQKTRLMWAFFIFADTIILIVFGTMLYNSVHSKFHPVPVENEEPAEQTSEPTSAATQASLPPMNSTTTDTKDTSGTDSQSSIIQPELKKMLQKATTEQATVKLPVAAKNGKSLVVKIPPAEKKEPSGEPIIRQETAPQTPEQKVETSAPRISSETVKNVQKPQNKKVTFRYFASKTKKVAISGSFTKWKQHSMKFNGTAWETTLYMPPGRYQYYFVVDGKQLTDPLQPVTVQGKSLLDIAS